MARKLARVVHVRGTSGVTEAWGPGTRNGAEPPPEVAKRITNPRVWEGEATEPEADAAAPVGDVVPAGTVDEVLAWVGEDSDRAAQALEAEEAKGDGARKGVVGPLQALLAE